jgi:hypothetical protein
MMPPTQHEGHRIAAVSDQPELASIVARWRVDAFFDYAGGYTVEGMTAWILAPPESPEETFVLFDHNQPVGTAGLALMRRCLSERRQDSGF